MLISYKIQTLNFKEDVNELLCQIDKKISTISKIKLDSLRYGVTGNRGIEYSLFILTYYRKILEGKLYNHKCFENYLIDDVISNIKYYLSVGKTKNFKQTLPKDRPEISGFPDQNNEDVTINNIIKEYGDHIINNVSNNNYVTEQVSEQWEQTDW